VTLDRDLSARRSECPLLRPVRKVWGIRFHFGERREDGCCGIAQMASDESHFMGKHLRKQPKPNHIRENQGNLLNRSWMASFGFREQQ
jgi:hypothetical protein